MATNFNNFQITAFVATTPSVNNFQSGASVHRFAISVRRTENEKTVSALINCEMWRKDANDPSFDCIDKGKLVTLSGYFKPEEWEANGVKKNRVVLEITKAEAVASAE